MANTKISNLTGAASVTDASVFPVVDSGATKKVTGTQIKTYARSGLSTVAVSGSYTDLTNKPSIFSGAYNDLTGKPTLFDGNYNSLTNKPTLFSGSYTDLTDKPTIPSDINQLADSSNLLSQGGGASYDQSLNTTDDVIFNSVAVSGEVVIGGTASQEESHLVVDASNYWTSIQWKNFTSPQDPTAGPFECQAQLLRVFKGDNAINGHEERVAISAVQPNGTNYNGLMITTSEDKIPDEPYNDGIGTMHNFIFGGDGTLTIPGAIVSPTGDVVIGANSTASPAPGFYTFASDGSFNFPNSIKQTTTTAIQCLSNLDTVVYTGNNTNPNTFKIVIQVTGEEVYGTPEDTQSCELMIARNGSKVAGSVYGLVYTSTNPLATFTTRINSSGLVEVVCRPTSTQFTVYVRSFVTEIEA